MTTHEIFDTIRSRVEANPAKVATLNASYQFELSGDGGGTFHVAFSNGVNDIGEGPIPAPGCTIIMSSTDFQALVAGTLNPTAAFMGGKLKLKGDMGLAMKLQGLLS